MSEATTAVEAPAAPKPAPKPVDNRPILQAFTWRGSQNDYRIKYRELFFKMMIREVVWMVQSESDGNIDITVIYR